MTTNQRQPASLRELLQRLRSAQKSNRGAPGYSRWINRPAGRVLAALAYKLGLSPNQVTVVSALVTFSGIVVIGTVRPTPWIGVLVAVLLALGFALDAADGQLSRLIGRGSLDGEWLDHVVDCIKCAALHAAVLISWYRFAPDQSSWWLLVPIAYGIQSSVWFFAITLTDQLRGRATGGKFYSRAVVGERAPWVRSVLVTPADYGVLCLSFVFWPYLPLFAYIYGALMIINVLLLLASLPRWYLEIRSLSGQPALDPATPNSSVEVPGGQS